MSHRIEFVYDVINIVLHVKTHLVVYPVLLASSWIIQSVSVHKTVLVKRTPTKVPEDVPSVSVTV